MIQLLLAIIYLSFISLGLPDSLLNSAWQASLIRLAKTQAMGFHVTESEMWDISKNSYWPETWTGDMFAEVLLAKSEYMECPLLRPYRPGSLRSDNPYANFYWDYYSQGKPCYAEIKYPVMEEVIDMIHSNHGVAVLAHPSVNLKDKEYLLDEIIKLGIDGIEAFSSYHLPAQALNFYDIAKDHKLFITCDSDYHGKTKPSIILGKHGCLISEKELRKQIKQICAENDSPAMKNG